jgi:8-oxo-dGTP pyrophosphatase MutT (NUDIX family)
MPKDRLWPVSIKAVVFVEGKVILLLNDRAEWELPGGRLEKGDTPEVCLIERAQRGIRMRCRGRQVAPG